MKEITIEAQSDYLEKIAKAKPINALAELIWNSLDADASNVTIKFLGNEIGTEIIEIIDDGLGFDYETAQKTFSSLGGSWKRSTSQTKNGRRLHGKEGHGRFKVFTLGNDVKWKVVYSNNDDYYEFTIAGTSSTLNRFKISDLVKSVQRNAGVWVTIADPVKQFKIFDEEIAVNELSSIYAPYLSSYPKVNILIGNTKVDTQARILNKSEFDLERKLPGIDNKEYSFSLDIYEWNSLGVKELFFCDQDGFPLSKYDKQIRGVGDYSYTAYLKSSYFLFQKEQGSIETLNLDSDLVPVLNETIKKLKNTFIERYRNDQRSVIDKWKSEDVYPYKEKTNKTAIEEAEEKVFDILALNLNEYVEDFNDSSQNQKKLQFKLLQQAIETNPGNIRKIIEEVINLPQGKAEELASLLEYTSLSSIISTSKLISDRLMFINGFEEIVYDVELKKRIKERSQLHRILADNTWFFGDEYFLAVDDQSLTEVLRKYSKMLSEDIVIDEPVKRLDETIGIVDLMLSKSIPKNHSDEAEYLVIELKSPKVKIGQKELNQIEGYAFAIANDERFRGLKTRWEFWVISTDMDDYAKMKANQRNYPKGVIYQNADPGSNDITIKAKTWSEILAENKHKHNFVKTNLNLSITRDNGLDFLHAKYYEYLKDD